MHCVKCGKENADGAAFCNGCGSPLQGDSPVDNIAAKEGAGPWAGTAVASPKNGRGLLIALIAASAALAAAAIVLIVLLTAVVPAEGFWRSESEGDVLAFTDTGTVYLYKTDGKLTGDYRYDNGTGEFSIMESDFDFKISGNTMLIDGMYEYERVQSGDFDVYAFVNRYTAISTGNTNVPENTIASVQTEPPQVSQPSEAPTPDLTPMSAQTPQTPIPDDPTTPPQLSIDIELAEKIVLNTWYGHYMYSNDGTEVEKSESDYYEFYSDGTLVYQYADGGGMLYGQWEIQSEQLIVVYENSEIGQVIWDMEITTIEGHAVLYLFDTRPGYEDGYWIYADIPVS